MNKLVKVSILTTRIKQFGFKTHLKKASNWPHFEFVEVKFMQQLSITTKRKGHQTQKGG